MRYAKGIMWLADCRIPFVDDGDMMKPTIATRDEFNDYKKTEGRKNIRQGGGFIKQSNQQGRFTPNLLVCDDMLNDGNVSEAKANLNYKWNNTDGGGDIFSNRGTYTPRNDKGSSSRYYDLDKWFDKIIKEL